LSCYKLSGNRRFGSFNNCIKTSGVCYGYLTEHLAIYPDTRFFAAIDKLAVPDIALPAGGTKTNNPQTPKFSFATFAVDAGIDRSPDSRSFGKTV
jgi:hypothetical protein